MKDTFETDKWMISPNKIPNGTGDPSENFLTLIFRKIDSSSKIMIFKKEDLDLLEKDLMDLRKWRKFKELKKDLEDK